VHLSLWFVDLVVSRRDRDALQQLTPGSVHGVLWLQTHFPSSEWDALFEERAVFAPDSLQMLLADADLAGLTVQQSSVVES